MAFRILRVRTSQLYWRVERATHLLGWLQIGDYYRAFLEGTFSVYGPLNAWLDWTIVGLDFDERRQLPLCRFDLLKQGPTERETHSLPRAEVSPMLCRSTDRASGQGHAGDRRGGRGIVPDGRWRLNELQTGGMARPRTHIATWIWTGEPRFLGRGRDARDVRMLALRSVAGPPNRTLPTT